MKIYGSHIGPVQPTSLRKVNKADASAEVDFAKSVDQVLLSSDATAIDTARKIIANTPDVRTEKVESLRQQIMDGSYDVSATDIANRMVTEGRLSKLGK